MMNTEKAERGFRTPEKWVIWGVFCAIVGLSANRFSVFAGLMFFSAGISLFTRKQKYGLAAVLCLAGILNIALSKYLI